MASSEENTTAGIPTESVNSKSDARLSYSGLSTQHLLFANLLQNRGGTIQNQEKTTVKSSCDRCATHMRKSLTDLRALSNNTTSTGFQKNNYNHHHHASCRYYKDQTSSKSSDIEQHAVSKPKQSDNAPLPSKTELPSPVKHSLTQEQHPSILFVPSVTAKEEKLKSKIPVRTSKLTLSSSPSLSLTNSRVPSGDKKSMIPRPSTTRFSSLQKHSAPSVDLFKTKTNDENDKFLQSDYKDGERNKNLAEQTSTNVTYVDSFQLDSTQTDKEKKTKTQFLSNARSCDWPLADEQEEDHSHTSTAGQHECVIKSSGQSNTITVRFRPTNTIYEVRVRQDMTVGEVIEDVCRQANKYTRDACYLWFDSRELAIDNTIFEKGLYQAFISTQNLPEVRLKYTEILQTSFHVGRQIFLASPEKIVYNEILNISLPSTKKEIIPRILKEIAVQIARNGSSVHQHGTVLIPLPNFSKQSIYSLPTISLKIPLSPHEFDWNVFLQCLADDLDIKRTDFIVVSAEEGSTGYIIKLVPAKFVQAIDIVKKVAAKVFVMFFPKSEQFVAENMSSNRSEGNKLQIKLDHFTNENTTKDNGYLSLDEIALALRLCERPAIISNICWKFMIKKSRQISTSIMQSIQSCSDEYMIDHASIVYNEQIYEKYQHLAITEKNERILFHGTRTENFDGIFEKNFQYYSDAKRTDGGWYGQGIYFSNSPKKALYYAKSNSKISYLICSLVQLGKTLTVTDMRYKKKPMHPDYDSHYVPVRIDGDPVSQGETPFFEEFVIKTSDQIMPLYIVGMLKVSCFVIWRDAKITDEANSTLFEEMKQQYAFNIYGSHTSVEALDILKCKLSDNEDMNCVVVTNGADDGEDFVRQCRVIRSSLPMIVYCKNTTYHQQWAGTLSKPVINVTSSPQEVFNFITNTLQK